jgi:hypothetical protein
MIHLLFLWTEACMDMTFIENLQVLKAADEDK